MALEMDLGNFFLENSRRLFQFVVNSYLQTQIKTLYILTTRNL